MVLNMPPLNSLVFGGSMLYAIPTFEIQTQISALVYLKHLLKAIKLYWTKVSNLKRSIRKFGVMDKIRVMSHLFSTYAIPNAVQGSNLKHPLTSSK